MFKKISFFVPLFFCALTLLAAGEEPPPAEAPVDVQFYFSKRDPNLAATEQALAAAVKESPIIRIERVPIDDKAGYARLAAVEKMLEIKDPGDMTIAFGPYALTSKGNRRDIELYFSAMMKRLIAQMKGDNRFKSRLAPDVSAYAKELFGKDVTVAAQPNAKFDPIVYYPVMGNGRQVGWAVDAYYSIGCPICSDAQLLIAADINLHILDVRPVREIERLATKMPDAETAKFIAQFKGVSPANLPVKVDVISRATKTSHAYQATINEVLEELQKRAK